MQSAAYRYPGLRPFQRDERDIFFVREKEVADLLALLDTERTVVLFGRPGTGKSSLINAGLIPALQGLGKTWTACFRFGAFQLYDNESLVDRAVRITENTTSRNTVPKWFSALPGNEHSLWYKLKTIQIAEKHCSFVLIFDQIEEIFTYPPDSISDFKRHLAELQTVDVPRNIRVHLRDKFLSDVQVLSEAEEEVLFQPLNVRFLFIIRSDRLSLLSSFSDHLPDILRRTYELGPLNREQAKDALEKPAMLQNRPFISPPFQYHPDTLDRLLRFLEGKRNTIDQIQLQITAGYIERIVIEKGVTVVTPDLIGDFESIYGNYYLGQISALPPEEQLQARRLLEEGLIYEEEERRIALDEGLILQQYGISQDLLDKLQAGNLLHRESREQGSILYEISHDTLVAPILKAKGERLQGEREKMEQQRLTEARLIAEEERKRRELAEVQRALARRLAVVAVLASCIALILAFAAMSGFQKAKNAQKEAILSAEQADIARSKAERASKEEARARLIADSSATVALLKSEEAERAWRQAEKNLQRAVAEEQKVRKALTQVTKARKDSEASRKAAELNLRSALQSKMKADSALVALSVKSDSLQTSENALKSAIADQIQRLKNNAAEAIRNLEYESAYGQCIQLLQLVQGPKDQETKNLVQELAYFYKKTDPNFSAKLKPLLGGIGISDISDKTIVGISTSNLDLLNIRYFPEMIPVGSTLSAGKTEVTYWQFNVYVKATKQALPPAPGWQITGDLPVTNISWYDAIAYSNWLTSREEKKDFAYNIKTQKSAPDAKGYSPVWVWVPRLLWSSYKDRKSKITYNKSSKGYRLPTETEWKQMAGPVPGLPNAAAWFKNNSGNQTHPVAGKAPNEYSLHDMYGNAQEWCWSDDFSGSYTERKGIQGVREQVLLGGSWDSSESQLKSRILSAPFNTYSTNGFRVVRSR